MHDVMPEAEKFRIGPVEFVPRFSMFLPGPHLVVPEGQTVVIDSDREYVSVENDGLIQFAPGRNLSFAFRHFINGMTGRVECGTAAQPFEDRMEWIVRDVPLDDVHDPWRWGNGIINAGEMHRVGRYTTPFAPMASALAGATQITLQAPVAGWNVGDELVLPDTRFLNRYYGDNTPRRESRVTIRAINGPVITLSKPLDFEHLAITWVDDDGEIQIVSPRVINLTRNIVIRSENPNGTRGHSANVGMVASWHVEGNQFVGMGRTTSARLDNTVADAMGTVMSLGENQIGKYADHDHHCMSRPDLVRVTRGNAYFGTGGSKWGKVVHGTHDVTVEDCAADDFQGAGFVTEDGYESRNTFIGNISAYMPGNGRPSEENADPARGNTPGSEGAGFWFRGVRGLTLIGNEGWNCSVGLSLFNLNQVGVGTVTIPDAAGGTLYTREVAFAAAPARVEDSVTCCNVKSGSENWAVATRYDNIDPVSCGNGLSQVSSPQGARQGNQWLVNPTAIGTVRSKGIGSSSAYTQVLSITGGGQIRGCEIGIVDAGAKVVVLGAGLVLQNTLNIDFVDGFTRFEHKAGVIHKPLGSDSTFIRNRYNAVWQPGDPLKADGWLFAVDHQFILEEWNGGGPYRLMFPQMLATQPTWSAVDWTSKHAPPEGGHTVGSAFTTFGLSYMGDVAFNPVQLPDILGAWAEPGLRPYQTPRAVVTYPNAVVPAPVGGSNIELKVTLTGTASAATRVAYVQVNGGVVYQKAPSGYDLCNVRIPALPEGLHTLTTWRKTPAGAVIPESVMTFPLPVGTAMGPTPVDCVQGPWVETIRVVGDWVTSGDTQTRTVTITETRETLTQSANGGAACGPSTRTRTDTETRPITWHAATVEVSDDGRVRVCRTDGGGCVEVEIK